MTGHVLVVEHERDAGLSLMADHLGDRAQVLRPYLGDRLPDALGPGHAGLLVLGGSMAAWEDDAAPWLPATRRLLAGAVRGGLPALGVCLGAQLLAAACGGTVGRGAHGLEVGTTTVEALPAAAGDAFFAGVIGAGGPSWPVRQYHGDAVTRLPDGAQLLVTGAPYPVQGFRVGGSAWGVQYHPEVSGDLFARWVEHGVAAGELAGAGDLLERAGDGEQAQAALAAAHARAFVDLLDRPRLRTDPGTASGAGEPDVPIRCRT